MQKKNYSMRLSPSLSFWDHSVHLVGLSINNEPMGVLLVLLGHVIGSALSSTLCWENKLAISTCGPQAGPFMTCSEETEFLSSLEKGKDVDHLLQSTDSSDYYLK
ncbi:hypothetical protein XENORESO_014320 [Xenotaenia resolanae]|uniref:Uncharacterized protein n=1 Tax=Xenotaenia resolanae TaxID=208358 RepID=A0ABV0VZ73_9TELE